MRPATVRIRRLVLTIAILAFGVLLLVLLGGWSPFLRFVTRLEALVRGAGPWGAAAFVLLAALSALLSPFSVVPLVPVAVLTWGKGPTFWLLLGGWMLGGGLAYVLGRFAGRPLARAFPSIDRAERWLEQLPRRRALALAVIFRVMLPSELGYAYGILRFRFWPYLLMTLASELPTALLAVYASGVLVEGRFVTFAFVLLGLAALALILWIARDRLLRPSGPDARPPAAPPTPPAPKRHLLPGPAPRPDSQPRP